VGGGWRSKWIAGMTLRWVGREEGKMEVEGLIATWIDVGGGVIWVEFWWDQSQIYGLGANSI
jgi:hypothetical protein